ncbi:hypothetical protein tinsulaeT_03360 [Thalassotalea insulae]|uniref:Solute-binding protein family 3/N-terminal domain-containing protein n=1 Tax=Thalassotalea insulae TaxID=2056778 RepID=A0ABQ6GQP4_9GAMM|nr:hypothetical protein [Thalassotalea insulae]GLX76996.1 hypothetical protein tinsulaeT_03360 [Thalassotalea insulae]
MTFSVHIKTYFLTLLPLFSLLNTHSVWSYDHGIKPSSTAIPTELIIPGPPKGFSKRNVFVEALLEKILKVQKLPITVNYFNGSLPQSRALHELKHNRSINLNWSMSTTTREAELRAIKIPIYKGMIGWRVLAISPNKQKLFSQIANLNDLAKLTAIQRYDWPDYKVLKFNALPVEGQIAFTHIPRAINQGLADYFPRSVLEIAKEVHWYEKENLAIETSLLLKYDAAYYFFVSKENVRLAQLIENGFQKLLANGDFDHLFNAYFGDNLAKLALDQRKVIQLKNPYF